MRTGILALFLLLSACSRPEPAPPPNAAAPSAPTAWVAARPAETLPLLEAPARVLVDPAARVSLTAPMPARVVRLHVREGEIVKEGQAVADLLMPELVRAAGEFLAADVRLNAAEARLSRLQSLRAENLVRATEIATAETEAAQARADRIEAEAVLRSAGYSGASARRLLGGDGAVSLASPVEGTVVAIGASTGDWVDPASGPIVRVAGESTPRVEARLTTDWPDDVGFRFVTGGGRAHRVLPVGRSPEADPRDGSTLAWFVPEDRELRLAPGQPGRLRVEAGTGSVVVPLRAVSPAGAINSVVVRQEKGPRRVPVSVLATSGADALVTGDLVPGDVVAADARLMMVPERAP